MSHVFALKIFMRKFTLKLETEAQTYAKKPQQITQQKQNLHTIPQDPSCQPDKTVSPTGRAFCSVYLFPLVTVSCVQVHIHKSGKHISFCNTSQNPYPFNVTHKDFVGLFIYIFSKTYFFASFFFPYISYLLAQTSALYCLLCASLVLTIIIWPFIKICYMFDVDFVCFLGMPKKYIRKCYLLLPFRRNTLYLRQQLRQSTQRIYFMYLRTKEIIRRM